jgi:hypothetical protein
MVAGGMGSRSDCGHGGDAGWSGVAGRIRGRAGLVETSDPAPVGDDRWDALLAALAAHLERRRQGRGPATYADFTELVVPELQRRGRVWPDYEGATLREYLGEPGQPRVADNHPAARYRAPKGLSQLPAEDPGQRSTR